MSARYELLCHPKVDNHNFQVTTSASKHDILCLQVAVNNAVLMHVVYALEDLLDDCRNLIFFKG